MDWVTDREIVPFEDRFKEDVPFGDYPTTWITPDNSHSKSDYSVFYLWGLSIGMRNGMEREYVYNIPVDPNLLAGFSYIAADGRWAYLCSDDELCKLDLLTGELTTLVKKNEGDIRWEVYACGKDTVCIFQLNKRNSLRIFYRDLHSDAEKTLYWATLPKTSPYDLESETRGIYFSAPSSTLGVCSFQMMNPAFYTVVQEELANPKSQFKLIYQQDYSKCWEDPEKHPIHLDTYPSLCHVIQDAYQTPYYIKYICDPVSGTVTEDYGTIDTCFYGSGQNHNHFDYEITKAETPAILDVAPVEIPNFSKLTGESPWKGSDTARTYVYSEFGYGQPYLSLDYPTWRLADFPVTDIELSWEYVYCITLEGTIVQLNYNGSICNTIYTSENELRDLNYRDNYIYFIDGSTIICIDETTGTWRPIFQTSLKEIKLFWSSKHPNILSFTVSQGMYSQNYQYNPETNELKVEKFVP